MSEHLKHLSKQLKLVGDLAGEILSDKVGTEGKYTSHLLSTDQEIQAARRLSTSKFLELGKIDPEEVGQDGLLKHDKLLPLSNFFGAYDKDGQLLIANRLLWAPEAKIEDLRVPLDAIDPAHADYLRQLPPGAIAEIGSLAKRDRQVSTVAELKLLRSMWVFAAERGVQEFVCGLEPTKVYPAFRDMFGDALIELSDGTVEFPGIVGQQKPLMINVREAVADQDASNHKSAIERTRRRAIGRFIVRGAPGVILSHDS